MDSYYVWITLGGMHLDEIPGGQLDEALLGIWDAGGITGDFIIAQHEADQVVFCVRRSLHTDIENFMASANEENPYPVFTRGIGDRKIEYDGGSFDGLEISNKTKIAQFTSEYREGMETARLQDRAPVTLLDLFQRARITANPPDPALSGPAILP